MSAVLAALTESWQEVRVHRTRLALSLLGIVVAVAAITLVTGLGASTRDLAIASAERGGGRAATITASVSGELDEAARSRADEAFGAFLGRYGVDHGSRLVRGEVRVQFPDGVDAVTTTAVDPAYGQMRRVPMLEGRFLEAGDAELLAPALVVSGRTWERLGAPDLGTAPAVEVLAPAPQQAVIVGVFDAGAFAAGDEAYLLPEAAASLRGQAEAEVSPEYSIWVGEDEAAGFKAVLVRELETAAGPGAKVQAQRSDFLSRGEDPFAGMAAFIVIVSSVVLFIGAVGFVNLSIVTVRQRIREIGIRRSFGATRGRVFAAVLLESVVGTLLAGVAGIAVAAIALRNLDVGVVLGDGIPTGPQPFPIEAALAGLGVSLLVGLAAGIVPAVVATRANVIDAIRG